MKGKGKGGRLRALQRHVSDSVELDEKYDEKNVRPYTKKPKKKGSAVKNGICRVKTCGKKATNLKEQIFSW